MCKKDNSDSLFSALLSYRTNTARVALNTMNASPYPKQRYASVTTLLMLWWVLMLLLVVAAVNAQGSGHGSGEASVTGDVRSGGGGSGNGATGSGATPRPTRPHRGRGQARRGGSRRGRNRNLERFGCEEIYVPMCKGLVPYTHTKLPNRFNHTTQLEVYRVLDHLQAYMDHHCSRNTRLLACSLYLPKCNGRRSPQSACKRTCMLARRRCARPLKDQLSLNWGEKFPCRPLSNRRCIRPVRETRCENEHYACVSNSVLSVCRNLTFTYGSLPNMFQQCDTQIINTEISQFDSLVATNCHADLPFLLCGVYSTFCVTDGIPFSFPCRELCESVREACEADYRRLNHNLPWPNKLQCHRYPLTTMSSRHCVMPREGGIFGGGK